MVHLYHSNYHELAFIIIKTSQRIIPLQRMEMRLVKILKLTLTREIHGECRDDWPMGHSHVPTVAGDERQGSPNQI